jgi:hypothetical protein
LTRAVVIVSTCSRKGVDYLPATLEALDRAGARELERLVLSDGPRLQGCGWPIICRDPAAHSTRANLWQAFRAALAWEAERLLYFEDDVHPCRNAVTRMAELEIPAAAAFVTFHDKKQILARREFGIHLAPAPDGDGRGFWGLQAVAIPRRTLEYLAALDPLSIRTANTSRNGDRVVEDFVARSPWPAIAYHSPSLVRHTGEVSAAHPDRHSANQHTPINYAGDDFDALSLRREVRLCAS